MGVTGLWKLIEPSGKPVPLETLENKVLAIDISIWLHQVVKGFQDNKGNTLAHAHLLGLFHRLCKLLYYRIKPVFVFDGGVPQLKRETIAKRNLSKNKLLNEADRLQSLLLQTLAKEKVVQQALGSNVEEILKSPVKQKPPLQKPDKDDIFKLPEIPSIQESKDFEPNSTSHTNTTDLSSDSDSSLDERHLRHSYSHNLQAIDVTSSQFKSLPADIRHEILTDIKETRKQSSWGRLHELPTQSNDFSSFQMQRLLKRRQVQISLEEAEKQMEGKSLTLNELRTFLSEEGVITASKASSSKQIASDENTRFLLVRDLKKAIEAATKKEEEEHFSEETKKPELSFGDEPLGNEFDEDLRKAIQMSLECDPVYNDKDYECDEIKMNREQRQQLKSAVCLAKAYLIEYGGMNEDEIKDMLQQTQIPSNEDSDELSTSFEFQFNDKFILEGEMCSPYRHMKLPLGKESLHEKKTELDLNIETSEPKSNDKELLSDSDDSDLVEVTEKADPSPTKSSTSKNEVKKERIEITIDPTKKLFEDEDIFAEVFKTEDKMEIVEIPENPDSVAESKEFSKEQFIEMGKPNDEVKGLSCSNEILTKLKKDLENIPKITLNDIATEIKVKVDDEHESTKNESSSGAKVILESLKKQISEIPKINLEDIKIESSIIDVTALDDEPVQEKKIPNPNEVIEILDDVVVNVVNKTPSKSTTKQDSISNYFEPQYAVKRTPEKVKENDEIDLQSSPKVKSPFFVRKTPGSSGKKHREENRDEHDDDTPSKRNKKISKMLFESPSNEKKIENVDDDMQPIDPVKIAAETLRENKTQTELESIASNIAKEKRELELERNKQDRMGTSITEKMNQECMQLLKLFGIPYIVAPMEAEAQCAFLNSANLTDGTITDDSDIWLFGGKTVYKNFFNQQKHVMEFRVENIEKSFSVDRRKLIQLAILVGSDYTAGVSGIGTVTALEILATFPQTLPKDGETSDTMSVLSSLRKFREWWRNSKSIGPSSRNALRKKLKNIDLSEGFPSLHVVEAYLNPKVDLSREKFSWGKPDIETIREFTRRNFGWTKLKTDEILNPVLKKLNEKKIQASIKNYFSVTSALSLRELKVSKRVKKAIDKMSLDPENPKPEDEPKPQKTKKRKTAKTLSSTETVNAEEKQETETKSRVRKAETTPSTSNEQTNKPTPKRKKRGPNLNALKSTRKEDTEAASTSSATLNPKLPQSRSSTEFIPQREKDLEEMRERKEKAAALLKKLKEMQNGTKKRKE